jgi:hypothetical protein
MRTRNPDVDSKEKPLLALFILTSNEHILDKVVSLPEYFSTALSLLNLLEKSLDRSKPATGLMQAH